MIDAHIIDGAALTKFIYWIKNVNKKKISEVQAQNKLERFRKMNKNYLYPSFDTIAGSGKNGAIVHYRAKKENCRIIGKKDIFLCDSGGQYKYGTTDVTRTLKFLKESNLDYSHGTGHGVGFFLNVHEGPQSISKINKVKIKEGMILSNEPGFYKKDNFGIRIENLVFVKKVRKKIFFENLTLAPIEKELINQKLLSSSEKTYLFKYHMNVYSKISKYLNLKERRWLASFI